MTIPQAFHLALQQHQAGRLAEAEALYRQIVTIDPRHADALHLLGVLAAQTGRHEEGLAMIRRAIALDPASAAYHSNYGEACRKCGRAAEAIAAHRRAIELQPDMAEFHSNLGAALLQQGAVDEAIASCRHAVQCGPGSAQAWDGLGSALAGSGRFGEAVAACRRAVALAPESVEFQINLAAVLVEGGSPADAVEVSSRAIELNPDSAEAHSNLGHALFLLSRYDEAIARQHRALELRPDWEMMCNLAVSLREVGRLDEALDLLHRAIALNPHSPKLRSFLILTRLYRPGFRGADFKEACREWDDWIGAPLRKSIAVHANRVDPQRRLKIGYVSPDFSSHVISRFLKPVLECQDHAEFEIYCYASVKRPDRVTEHLRSLTDVWRDVVGVSDADLAQRIRADEIDILVDLTMHCGGSRLLAFARKPAPVQVAWLSYPATTGLRAMDYRLTDAHMEPGHCEWAESVEKVVRLPDCWFCYDPIDELPPPGELPAIRTGHVTFGSLNYFPKMNDAALHCWARLLSQVKGSRLLMRCPAGETQLRVRRVFEARGIGAERLELVAWMPSAVEFLKLYQRIDIGLDPFTYTGGTTTCEALWMGVPIVTLPGDVALARVSFSILSTIGLPELAADSEETYVEISKTLAGDLPRLAELRSTLRERMKASPFMDGPRMARNIERAFREMWVAWCERQQP